MADNDSLEQFEERRGHLRGVAYRMLGSLAEADDAVQETWLRLSRSGGSGVDSLGGNPRRRGDRRARGQRGRPCGSARPRRRRSRRRRGSARKAADGSEIHGGGRQDRRDRSDRRSRSSSSARSGCGRLNGRIEQNAQETSWRRTRDRNVGSGYRPADGSSRWSMPASGPVSPDQTRWRTMKNQEDTAVDTGVTIFRIEWRRRRDDRAVDGGGLENH
jgi:hypothetical protein